MFSYSVFFIQQSLQFTSEMTLHLLMCLLSRRLGNAPLNTSWNNQQLKTFCYNSEGVFAGNRRYQ